MGVLFAGSFLSVMNQTSLFTIVPAIMGDLGIDAAEAQWLFTIFMLTHGVLVPVTAFLIERFSSRSLLLAALGFFLAGTLLAAAAPSFPFLLAARVFQGCGAGLLLPLLHTVIMTAYPVEKRGAVMGIHGTVIAFAPTVAPVLSGWIADLFSWRAVFWFMAPAGLAVFFVALKIMRNVTEQRPVKMDVLSLALSCLGWGGLLYGFSLVGTASLADPAVFGPIAAGALMVGLLVIRQNFLVRPFLNFRVFRSRVFVQSVLLTVIIFTLMNVTQILVPIYLQDLRGHSASFTGLVMMPAAIVFGVLSLFAGKIFDRSGARVLSVAGFALGSAAMLLLVNLDMDDPAICVSFSYALLLLGNSLNMMPLVTAGLNTLSPPLVPHGSAMINTMRMTGGAICTAIIVSVMNSATAKSPAADPGAAALDGISAAFACMAGMTLFGLLVSFALPRARKTGSGGSPGSGGDKTGENAAKKSAPDLAAGTGSQAGSRRADEYTALRSGIIQR